MPKVSLFSLRKIIISFLLIVALFGSGYYFGRAGYVADAKIPAKVTISRQNPPDKSNVDFSLFWKVWDTMQTSYFDSSKIQPGKMVYGAIQGMVAAVGDPYTVFLPPEENKVVEEDLGGNFDGVGIQIGFKGTQLAVVAPLPGSPAEKAGVKAGDLIIGIKDDSKKVDMGTAGISLTDAVKAIRGERGTKVTLALLRDGQTTPILVDLVRETVNVPTIILTYSDNDTIAHLRLLKFGGETQGEWQKAVREILKKKEVKGIVLDLRNNPGGYLQEAVDIAADFVKQGSTVVIEERGNTGAKTEYKTERMGLLTTTPVVLLVNGGSASASEILSGALRDINHTKLVGEKTFGKGTIQEPQQLANGAGLHITIAKWLTPSGTWVHGNGLDPDVKVEDKADTPEDEQLQEAVKILKESFK